MGAVWIEIRFGARSLTRSPAISLCALLCLGVGIGATTAISSALSRARAHSSTPRVKVDPLIAIQAE